MKVFKKRKHMDISAISELIYLSSVAMYLLRMSFQTTLFFIPWPVHYDAMLRFAVCSAILLKSGHMRPPTQKEWFLCILTGILFRLSWLSTGYASLLDIALLSLGAIGISYRKILKVSFWVEFYVLLTAILGSLTGCIVDLVYLENDSLKHSFGIVYTTDFAAHVVFLYLTFRVLYGGASLVLSLCHTLALMFFIYYYSGAKCSTAVLLILAASIPCLYIADKHAKRRLNTSKIPMAFAKLALYTMPLCIILILALTLLYEKNYPWINTINTALNHRLRLGSEAINTYGITPFGTAFEQIGAGGSTVSGLFYNFVDSSYVLILVRYGFFILLAICFQYVWLEKKALAKTLKTLALAVALIAIHSTIEHHLLEIEYNLFLILPFASFSEKEYKNFETDRTPNVTFIRKLLYYACGVACIGVLIFTFPKMISHFKTLVHIFRLDLDARNVWFILGITVLISFGYICWKNTYTICKILITKSGLSKWLITKESILLLGILCLLMIENQVIIHAKTEYQSMIENDKNILGTLSDINGEAGSLYADYMPEIYKREFPFISNSILAAEGGRRHEQNTILVRNDTELHVLLNSGYHYGELPSGIGIYTNSNPAKKKLEDAGITFTDYYSKVNSVNLDEIALINKLPITETGSLLISGTESTLLPGFGIVAYQGTLQITCRMRLSDTAVGQDAVAGVLLSADRGSRGLSYKEIDAFSFDEGGYCTYTFEFYFTVSCREVQFTISVPNNITLEIEEITYQKIN